MDAIHKVLLKRPAAIHVGDFVFRETAYGVVKRLRFFVEHIERERGRMGLDRNEVRILDVGCGTGTYVTIPLAEIGYTVVGVDCDEASIDRARHNAGIVGAKGLALYCGHVRDLEIGTFHVVICSEVLEHQSNPKGFLEELGTVLIEGGLLLVTVPNGHGYYELESWVTRRAPKLPVWADTLERLLVRVLGSPSLRRRHRSEYGGVSPAADQQRNAIEQSSLASDSHHDQHFTASDMREVITAGGYEILGFRNNTILAGSVFNALVRSIDPVLYLNGRAADFLPVWLAADWLFVARKLRMVDGRTMTAVSFDDPACRSQSANLETSFDVLRNKWSEVPAGTMRRAKTSQLVKLSDEELLRFHLQATREATEGSGFPIRGWYHCLYKDILSGKRVMDVGSGIGIDGIAFAVSGASVTFVDIVETNVEMMRRLCALRGVKHAEFCFLKDLSSLSHLPNDYDVIWCQGSLINAPFEDIRAEAQALLRHLKIGGRWIELAYPKARWEREGCMPFKQWGDRTDGGAPWMEWYDLDKIQAMLEPAQFDILLHFEFHNHDFNWFDLKRRA